MGGNELFNCSCRLRMSLWLYKESIKIENMKLDKFLLKIDIMPKVGFYIYSRNGWIFYTCIIGCTFPFIQLDDVTLIFQLTETNEMAWFISSWMKPWMTRKRNMNQTFLVIKYPDYYVSWQSNKLTHFFWISSEIWTFL